MSNENDNSVNIISNSNKKAIQDKKPIIFNINDNNSQVKLETILNLSENYFKKTFLSNKILNIIIILFLPIIIVAEIFFRNPLFNKSLTIEENIQKYMGGSDSIGIKFFKYFSDIGGIYFMGVCYIIVFIFFTIIDTFVYGFGIIFAVYLHAVMKIWYANSRPYLEKEVLYQGVCDGGYGNPSGHSIIALYGYLTFLSYILKNKNIRNKIILKIIFIIIFIVWILLIPFSRIVLGVHGLNQVIYGSLLGIWLFLFFSFVFKFDQMPVSLYRKFFKQKYYILFFVCFFIICLALAIISRFTINKNKDFNSLNQKVDVNCKRVKEYKRFHIGSLHDSLILVAMIGLYCGQCLFWFLIDNKYKKNKKNKKIGNSKKDENNNRDNENDLVTVNFVIDELINKWSLFRSQICAHWWNMFKIIGVLIVCLIPIVLYLFISKNIDVGLILTFKTAVPMFIIAFLIFSFGLYEFVVITCGSKEILLSNANTKSEIIIQNN